MAVAQAVFFTSAMFRLQAVEVRGNARVSDDVVKSEARLPLQQHLLGLDVNEAAARVKKIHWVQGVSVRRVLPGGTVIRVQERVPVLAVGTPGAVFPQGWLVVSEDGMVLAPARPRGDEKLPRLIVQAPVAVGAPMNKRLVSSVLRLRANLPQDLAAQVTEIRADASSGLDLVMSLGGRPVEVRMGDSVQTRYKFRVLGALVEKLRAERRPIAYIDLRYHDPAVGHLGPPPKPKD